MPCRLPKSATVILVAGVLAGEPKTGAADANVVNPPGWQVQVTTQTDAYLGPLPVNISSEYLETVGGGSLLDFASSPTMAAWHISLLARPTLPTHALLEVQFPNPLHPDEPLVVDRVFERKTLAQSQSPILVVSPKFEPLPCGLYPITVKVFADASKGRLIGSHLQNFRSSFDTRVVTSPERLVDAIDGKGPACKKTIAAGEHLVFSIPPGWQLALRQTRGNTLHEHYTPFGQTTLKWRSLIAVTQYFGQHLQPGDFLRNVQERNSRDCIRPLPQPVVEERVDSFARGRTMLVCGEVPGTDRAEVSLHKFVSGRRNAYNIFFAWRTDAGSPEAVLEAASPSLEEGRKVLGTVWVCDTRDGARPCPVSTSLE